VLSCVAVFPLFGVIGFPFLVPTGGPVAIKTNLANDFSTWSTNLNALAKCSNVYMKIGGVGMPIFGLGKLSPPIFCP